ncbi:hypothetical protein WISP_34640 [Willisornis vidua]|uniref:Uncharacterized protein n=1 Tax=Willisornis vidua TaxID=1566151 RepID=A0ABQ9DPZ5_9PASS|nr:hypothetical protein WISP_34640 [Willisornis vidua]
MLGGEVLCLILPNKEGLVGNMNAKGNLGCLGHVTVEFRILKAEGRVKRSLSALHYKRVDFDLFKELLEGMEWEKAIDRKLNTLDDEAEGSLCKYANDIKLGEEANVPEAIQTGEVDQ